MRGLFQFSASLFRQFLRKRVGKHASLERIRRNGTNVQLTFKNGASYIKDGRTATLQMLHYIYIFFSTNICTDYFKHAAHSPFFS
jgi:hypothetical protein